MARPGSNMSNAEIFSTERRKYKLSPYPGIEPRSPSEYFALKYDPQATAPSKHPSVRDGT